jgi:hypothetical protein
MLDKFLTCGLQYVIYVLEALLFFLLVRRGQWKRQWGVSVYLVSLLAVDALARPTFLYRYGFESNTYGYCYWLTDVLLALQAFGLMCFFFHRVCARDQELWRFFRTSLIVVPVIVAVISYAYIYYNYDRVQRHSDRFIYEFDQNLYFACLVLNTFLYVMLQRIENADQELGLLVCGMGIQFAGPAASLAIVTMGWPAAYSLLGYVMPVCTLSMLLVWLYSITGVQKKPTRRGSGRLRVPILAEAAGVK